MILSQQLQLECSEKGMQHCKADWMLCGSLAPQWGGSHVPQCLHVILILTCPRGDSSCLWLEGSAWLLSLRALWDPNGRTRQCSQNQDKAFHLNPPVFTVVPSPLTLPAGSLSESPVYLLPKPKLPSAKVRRTVVQLHGISCHLSVLGLLPLDKKKKNISKVTCQHIFDTKQMFKNPFSLLF